MLYMQLCTLLICDIKQILKTCLYTTFDYIIVVLGRITKTQYLLWFGWAAFGTIVLTSAALLALNRRNVNSENMR